MKRRDFIKSTAIAGAGIALYSNAPQVFGKGLPGNKLVVGVMGVNSRGRSLAKTFAQQKGVEIAYICDVDENAMARGIADVEKIQGKKPKGVKDFRTILDDKSLDAIAIAAPDHWHAPAAILACKAGKNVYVEKPCSHNPYEGELLVQVARKYNTLVQMGTQRRSWPIIIQAMNELHDGIIGRVYFAKAWYTNNRKSIGIGKPAPVPSWLDYELWQGPAPRREFKDNLIHYNWHWFWNWGTGEALNNGTHEMDMVRWGLDVNYAKKVSSLGGRYQYKDDWETPDTQVISIDFEGDKSCTWESRSCNNYPVEGSGRGVVYYGDKGTMVTNGDNAYKVFDRDNKLIKDIAAGKASGTANAVGPGEDLDAYHISNFLDSIRDKSKLTADIETGFRSVLLCQLGNIAYRSGRILNCDPTSGHILNDPEAMKLWTRDYENGWAPTL
jgi:predicted dehydrogenase